MELDETKNRPNNSEIKKEVSETVCIYDTPACIFVCVCRVYT